ncbi:MAG: transposase [Flavobacteriales bacterium]|jgi:putative transposase|nr:transposase [Flavobacteriales bacterium]
MKERKKFSKEEKVRIVQEAAEQGVKATLDKYGVYPATYYDWKRKLESMGEQGLDWGMTPAHIKEIRRLEKENERLKRIVADQQLESQLKDELLKKKYPLARKSN